MRLPLRWGIPALLAIWIGYGFVESQTLRSLLLIVAMGIALWTAFSLNIPPRQPDGEDAAEEQDEEGPPGGADGGNDGGRDGRNG